VKNSNEKLIRKRVGPFEIDDYEVFQVTNKWINAWYIYSYTVCYVFTVKTVNCSKWFLIDI